MRGKIGFPVWTAGIVVVAGVLLLLDAAGAIGRVPGWVLIVFVAAAAYLLAGLIYSPFADRRGFCPYARFCPFRKICPFSR
jgi:amino acid transporter